MNRRLPAQPGEWIDRSRLLTFRFEGRELRACHGDVISSALYANGQRLMGRSFKYHRPRSSYSAAGHDANAIFTDGRRTNLRGDSEPVTAGLDLRAVNTFGSLAKDRMSAVGLFSKFMPVGFYYKTFHTPAWMFPFHERQIRKAAGLGAINTSFPPTHSPKDYAWCDVLVVGGGPAGMAAARAASQAGAKVMLVEEQPRLGGSLAWQHGRDQQAAGMLEEHVRALTGAGNVEVRTGTMAGGYYADHWVGLFDATRLTKLRARCVIYATGAIEQPAVFGHNDLPGVMLASAAQRLIRLYAVKPFDRVALLVANSDGCAAALDMLDAGIEVAAVADLRPAGEPSPLGQALASAGVKIFTGHTIYETQGKGEVAGALIAPIGADGEADRARGHSTACDGVAVSVGWMPNSALLSQAGIRFKYEQAVEQLVPVETAPPGVFAAGRVNGVYDLAEQLADGRRAGLAAAKYLDLHQGDVPAPARHAAPARSHPYPIFKHHKKKNFVEFDEDLHLTDFANAHQEGYDSVELLKRYSTVGMGPSQGKLANMNAVRILAKLNGKSINETGTTTSRPFYQPVSIGHLAGRRFHPMRQTPMHDWHAQHGAVFFHAGEWYRPEYYGVAGTSRTDCIFAEAQQIRASLGMIDVGTLGKILVNGPDAGELLERIYTGKFANLTPGRTRYAVGLDESGVVIEDGVVARLAADRFYVTATSSGVGYFYREMLRWAALWRLDVTLSNVTGQLAAMNLAGPRSREALAGLTTLDLSPEAFPYLGVREGEVAGVRAIVMRVGFVGELGYEVHVPASQGEHVWRALFDAGADFGIRPAGVEAQRLLRLEKGHQIITHDTDALTTPHEAGLAWAIGKDKVFFIGQRSLQIHQQRPLTRKFVGFKWDEHFTGALPDECHLIVHQGRIAGRIASVAPRTTMGYPVGMGFVEPALAEPGTRVEVRLTDGSISVAQVTTLPFYDPQSLRQEQ